LCRHEGDFKIARAANDPVPWQVKPIAELMFLLTALKRHGPAQFFVGSSERGRSDGGRQIRLA
jgi:hypothetical protein